MRHHRSFTPAIRRVVGLGVVLLAGAAFPQAQEAGPMYPASVYPATVELRPRVSEMPFTETAETARYGFDVPFPDGPRQAFRIEDFGGKADGTTDCTPAFYRALGAALASAQPAELRFSNAGRYYFRPDPTLGSDDMAILNIRGARNLVLCGQGCGTVLVAGEPALGCLRFVGCETVMLRDLSVDYNPLPYTQGIVGEVNAAAGEFTLAVTPGFPDPAAVLARHPEAGGGHRMAPARNGAIAWAGITVLPVHAVTPLGAGNWRFKTDAKELAGFLQPGMAFVYVGRRVAQHAIAVELTKGFYARDMAVFASPSVGICLKSVDGAQFDGYTDTLMPGSDRLLATDADGLFCHGVRGGITVRNCAFWGQGDDCINLHCPAFYGREVTPVSDTQLDLGTAYDLRPGDPLEVIDATAGKVKGTLSVAAVAPGTGGKGLRVTLAAGLSSVGYNHATDRLYPAALAAPNFKIVHNYFGQCRVGRVLIQARGGLIEANTSETGEGYGVCLTYGGTAWPEGVVPADVTVRNNLFRNLTNEGLAPTIEVSDNSEFRNFRNLTIVGNRFVNPRKMAILLKGVQGARIADNRIETEAGRRNTWNHPQWYPVDCSVFLENCGGVSIQDLTVQDPGIKEAVVFIGRKCDPGEAGVTLSRVSATTAPGIPVVRDER